MINLDHVHFQHKTVIYFVQTFGNIYTIVPFCKHALRVFHAIAWLISHLLAFLGFYLYKAGFYIDKTREFIIINSILFINPTFPWRDIKYLPLL